MNERIKELAMKAAQYSLLPEKKYDKIFNEKFAELIVRECALTAGLMEHEGRPDIGAQILDNFGVEE